MDHARNCSVRDRVTFVSKIGRSPKLRSRGMPSFGSRHKLLRPPGSTGLTMKTPYSTLAFIIS